MFEGYFKDKIQNHILTKRASPLTHPHTPKGLINIKLQKLYFIFCNFFLYSFPEKKEEIREDTFATLIVCKVKIDNLSFWARLFMPAKYK